MRQQWRTFCLAKENRRSIWNPRKKHIFAGGKHIIVMKIKTELLTIMLLFAISCFGQDASGRISQESIDKLNRYVLKQYCKATHKPASSVSATIVNTYLVDYSDAAEITKDFIASGEFLEYIRPSFRNGRNKDILRSETIILESDQEAFGYYAEGHLDIIKNEQIKALANIAIENNIVSMYQFRKDMWYGFRIGVDKERKIYIIEEYADMNINKFCVGIWPIEEFPDEDWPRVFPWIYSRIGVNIFGTQMYESRFPNDTTK